MRGEGGRFAGGVRSSVAFGAKKSGSGNENGRRVERWTTRSAVGCVCNE